MEDWVWVFHGSGAQFATAVFSSQERAAEWIKARVLTGVLTAYPVDEGVYDWAVREALFSAKGPEHQTAQFVQKFTSASQPHIHFEEGNRK